MSAPHVIRLTPHFYWPQLEHSGWPVRFDAIGGMQTQIYEQTLAVSAAGVPQTVFTLAVPGAPKTWQVDEHTTVHGVRVPLLPVRSRLRGMVDLNVSWLLGVLMALSKLHMRPASVIHVHWSGVAIPPMLAVLLKALCRIPVMATIHCSSLATYHAMSSFDRIQHWMAQRFEREAVIRLDHLVVLTQRIASVLREIDSEVDARLSIIPDAINRLAFASGATLEAEDQVRREAKLPTGSRVVGYIGRIAREKGWRTLIDVANAMRDQRVHFLVCGDGNERDLLERDLARNGLADRFSITGYLPHRRVAAAIACCDAILVTSQHEEFGSVLLEAMALRRPAVAFKVGGIPDVLDHGKAGVLVEQGDVKGVVSALNEILSNGELRQRICDYAVGHIDRNYERAAATGRIVDIYKQLAAAASTQADRRATATEVNAE